MSLTSESDEAMVLHNSMDSPSADDDNSCGNGGSNSPMKKGPWTSAEDEILVDFVRKHGEGNWNAVQKHTGLARCGKSCRLRWANHLRPDLKKGPFSPEEERQIIELHAKLGNKWARMAAEMPGRTDNEIKNFWNTRIKRRQRAGLPIYPPDICQRPPYENQQVDDIDSFSTGDMHLADLVSVNEFEIPPVEFKSFNQQLYSSAVDVSTGNIPEIPASFVLAQGLQPSKPPYGPELLFTGYNTPIISSFTGVNQLNGDASLQIAHTLGFSSPYEHNTTVSDQANLFPGSHAVCSTELPSLQNQTGGWVGVSSPSFPLPPMFDDVFIQTTHPENTCILSPPNSNSGLLDAVLYESETKKFSTNNGFPQTSDAPTISAAAAYMMNDSAQDVHEVGWGYDEQVSPVGYSSSSVFCDSSPVSVNSFDEHQSAADGFPGSHTRSHFS